MYKGRSQFMSQYDWLWYLYNDLGCSNLEIAGGGINSKGFVYFTKRYRFEDLLHMNPNDYVYTDNAKNINKKVLDFIGQATHRTVLDIELCIDVDEPGECKTIKEKAKQIIDRIKTHTSDYFIYFTGSKSYHIHIFSHEFRGMPDNIKSMFLGLIGADTMKVGRNTIALEGALHYRSQIPKAEVIL